MVVRAISTRAMVRGMVAVVLLALSLTSTLMNGVDGQLSPNYYEKCPAVQDIARAAFMNRVSFFNIVSLAANILRLAFHDCAVDGCEGSVLLSSTPDGSITDEKLSKGNVGIGNLPVIEYMKQQLDAYCYDNATGAPLVSCADTLALAGREAFNFAKGLAGLGQTIIPIPLGRRDGLTASTSAADAQLLPADATADAVILNFQRIGLSLEEIVALLGSHTIGVAHCENIVGRMYPPDTKLATNPAFYATLVAMCPQNVYSSNTVVALDDTNTFFDTQYFLDSGSIINKAVLTVDVNIASDSRTAPYVANFRLNQQHFFEVFTTAYIKLTSWRVLTGTQGEIRRDCTKIN